MKNYLSLLFTIFSLSVFSQTKEIKIEKKKVTESKTIQDFITDIPKDCKVTSFIFSGNLKSGYREFSCNGDGLAPEIKKLLEKGNFIYIEKIKADCTKSIASQYKIILE